MSYPGRHTESAGGRFGLTCFGGQVGCFDRRQCRQVIVERREGSQQPGLDRGSEAGDHWLVRIDGMHARHRRRARNRSREPPCAQASRAPSRANRECATASSSRFRIGGKFIVATRAPGNRIMTVTASSVSCRSNFTRPGRRAVGRHTPPPASRRARATGQPGCKRPAIAHPRRRTGASPRQPCRSPHGAITFTCAEKGRPASISIPRKRTNAGSLCQNRATDTQPSPATTRAAISAA